MRHREHTHEDEEPARSQGENAGHARSPLDENKTPARGARGSAAPRSHEFRLESPAIATRRHCFALPLSRLHPPDILSLSLSRQSSRTPSLLRFECTAGFGYCSARGEAVTGSECVAE